MKQIEYTEKQKLVMEILKPIKDKVVGVKYDTLARDIRQAIKDIENKYDIKPQYLTLRQYINEISNGAYHRFYFDMELPTITIKVIDICGVYDFERIYNPRFLDMFFVIADKSIDNGGDCENYECQHHLKLGVIDNE